MKDLQKLALPPRGINVLITAGVLAYLFSFGNVID
jgi:hypothetical protein